MRALFRSLFAKPPETRLDRIDARLERAAERFRLAAEASPGAQARLLWRLAGATADLNAHLRDDPAAADALTRLALIHIPEMAVIAGHWAACAKQDPLAPIDAGMMGDFETYLSAIEEAVAGCATGRYRDLSAANTMLDEIMERHRT